MTVDVGSFGQGEQEFAQRFTRDDLPGLLRKKLEVPAGCVALVYASGASAATVLEAGQETSEVERGVLVKRDLRLEFELDAGRSKDSLAFTVSLGLALQGRAEALDLGQLEQTLLKDAEQAGLSALLDYFRGYLRDAVRFFVTAREAETLATSDQRKDLEDHLREELKKPLFEVGLDLQDVLHPRFHSVDFEARQRVAAEANVQGEALAREKELQALRHQLDRDALLADIEARDEADRTRKEKRLERYEEIRSRMGDDDRKALIMMLDDDDQRARLIRELIEKDMSPEQRSSMQLGDMEQRVEDRLKELQLKLAQLSGGALVASEDDPITRRVLCVVGKRVLAFDPKTNLHPEVPKEVYDTEDGTLGYLRSARVDRIEGTEYVLAGGQRGVYRMKLDTDERLEYAYTGALEGKGGANAVAYFDGRIFATHSEMGLTEWTLDGSCRSLCTEVTRDKSAVRGATVVDGRLYFSAGSEVMSLDLATGTDTPVRYRGSDDSITSFLVLKDEVVAGNRSGKLFRWTHDDPGSAESIDVVKKNPIYMLRHTQLGGQSFFIIGSKDFTVTVAAPRKDVYREYQAREEVRWVEGAGDYVFGVSRSGFKVFCWEVNHQSSPKLTIRVSDKVQDLFVLKQLPKKDS
jgi:hypothetical protein